MRSHGYVRACLFVSLLSGCASEADRDLALLDEPPSESTDADLEQRRRRMDVRAQITTPGSSTKSEVDLGVRKLTRHVVLQDCLSSLRVAPGGSLFGQCTADQLLAAESASGERPPFASLWTNTGTWLDPSTSLSSFSTTTSSTLPTVACVNSICRMHVASCVSQRLMELSSTALPTTFKGVSPADATKLGITTTVPVDITLSPQDTESATQLSEDAFHYANFVATSAGENLRYAASRPSENGSCSLGALKDNGFARVDDKTITLGESVANLLAEATFLAEEAARASVKHQLAVSDSEFGRTPDLARSSKNAWTDGTMSRSRAAHLIVGGDLTTGLPDLTNFPGSAAGPAPGRLGGICAVPELSEKGKQAVDILRLSAIGLDRISDLIGVPNKSLFEAGASTYTKDGRINVPDSVRERLAERLGDASLMGTTYEQFLSHRQLADGDVSEARKYLREEAVAFARDPKVVVPKLPLTSATNATARFTSFPIYGATSTRPTPQPASHYGAAARFTRLTSQVNASDPTLRGQIVPDLNDGTPGTNLDAAVRPDTRYARKGLSQLLDYSASVAADVVSLGVESTGSAPVFPAFMRAPLGTLVGTLASEVQARIEACYRYVTPTSSTTTIDEVRLRIYGPSSPLAYQVVLGVSALRCAVEGQAEGGPCAQVPLVTSVWSVPKALPDGSAGRRDYLESVLDITPDPTQPIPSVSDTYYLVRLRTGAVGVKPGNYESVGGFRVLYDRSQGASSAYRYCTMVPVNRDLEALVAETLTPSTDFCGRPATTCAGPTEFDLLPLESEISADGDAYESSYKTHLLRAREASERADQLGEQLLEAGLGMDQRIEGSLERLGDLCGEAVSVLDTFPATGGVLGAWCPKDDEPCTDLSMICKNHICVTDPEKAVAAKAASDPQLDRLSQCLSGDKVVPYTSVGSQPVCIWVNKAGEVCKPVVDAQGKRLSTYPCPYLATAQGTCVDPPVLLRPTESDGTVVPVQAVTTYLDLFRAPQESVGLEKPTPPCEALRELRTNPTLKGADRERKIDEVNNGFFAPANLQNYATRLGWEASVNDYSAVTLDGAPLYFTGNPLAGNPAGVPSKAWPCISWSDPENKVSCSSKTPTELHESLACSYTSACAVDKDTAARSLMNHRLGRAVLAARILTGVGVGEQFRGPFLPDPAWLEDPTTRSWYDPLLLAGSVLLDTAATVKDFICFWCSSGSSTPSPPPQRVAWPAGNTASQLVTGYDTTGAVRTRPIAYGSALKYALNASDATNMTTRVFNGQAVCINQATDTHIWTHLPGDLFATPKPKGLDLRFPCPTTTNPLGFGMMFKTYGASRGTAEGIETGRLWDGLDGDRGLAVGGGPANLPPAQPNPRVRGLLASPPVGSDPVWLQPWTWSTNTWPVPGTLVAPPEVLRLTAYWEEDRANTMALASEGLRGRDILDAMELLCEVARVDERKTGGSCLALPPPSATALQDLALVENYMTCVANEIMSRAQVQILVNVPQIAVDALKQSHRFEGELGAAAGEFAAALINVRAHQRTIDTRLRQLSGDIKQIRIELRKHQIAEKLADVAKWSTTASQTASCLNASLDTFSVSKPFVGAAQAAVTCANAMAQIGFAMQQNALTKMDVAEDQRLAWLALQDRVGDHARSLQQTAEDLDSQVNLMRASLAKLEAQRFAGRRELAKVMMAGSDSYGNHYALNTSIRRRFNTLQIRYERARADAIRLSWVARRAVEQRLGMTLSDLHKNMALVDAPARWVDSLCTLPAIDYTRIRKEGGLATDDFADSYVGDYVRKLERVVQSYEFDFPFNDAQDTAVISLREDIARIRKTCSTSVNNLLAYSARLDTIYDPEDVQRQAADSDGEVDIKAVWTPVGCVPLSDGSIKNCIKVEEPLNPNSRPLRVVSSGTGDIPVYRITFAPGWNQAADPSGTTTSFRRVTDAAGTVVTTSAIAQSVELQAGWYRLSWYGQWAYPYKHWAANAVTVRTVDGMLAGVAKTAATYSSMGGQWYRFHQLVLIQDAGKYQIALTPNLDKTLGEHYVDLAGVMLENVDDVLGGLRSVSGVVAADYPPGLYVATTQAGTALDEVCRDTTGDVFRSQNWKTGCMELCPTGYASCPDAQTHCFMEYRFDITVPGIESGAVFGHSGFAYGNYNYRIDSLAVNFVGTGLRDCSQSFFPASCYGSGNIPYTLEHVGPYQVRNHKGGLYDAPLFMGRIEHGRGLAAERYLTNPLSPADRGLVEPYEHRELRGRPLTGSYVLRVWDTESFDFRRLEDVQLLLDYRYWTRFE